VLHARADDADAATFFAHLTAAVRATSGFGEDVSAAIAQAPQASASGKRWQALTIALGDAHALLDGDDLTIATGLTWSFDSCRPACGY
jgi:hypothetical protein